MNSFYIGSGFQNKKMVREIADVLVREGMTHTYDWTQTEKVENITHLAHIANCEVNGVKAADVVLILLPGGRGTHTELGLAIAAGKPVLLYDLENCWHDQDHLVSFYYADGVKRVTGDVTDVIEEMKMTAADLANSAERG
ncbi:nucleoside 2-deoxyribosyltransferase [Fictibacillus iocasae]|uniref:Nucleoside 2-deoxyribosyltransferase n=1 Tax=Fictibacillus iocasae TaxID=2715437 RepID=A0ABW2NIZ4_9BACL